MAAYGLDAKDEQHYGMFPGYMNPYVTGSTITEDEVMKCLIDVSKLTMNPVKITAKEGSIADAFTKCELGKMRPPSVSNKTLAQRFNIVLSKDKKSHIQLGTIFEPDLRHCTSTMIRVLLRDVIALCSVTTTHHKNVLRTPTTKDSELTNEQELFVNILQTLSPSPFIIHAECQTIDDEAVSSKYLPGAKFDIVVDHPVAHPVAVELNTSDEFSADGICFLLNGTSNEKTDLLMTNKTDVTMNLDALNSTIILEALIFSTLNSRKVTTIMSGCPAGSSLYVRPLIKRNDVLLTFPSVVELFTSEDVGSSSLYPQFDTDFLDLVLADEIHSCGWDKEYDCLSRKYPLKLKQTKPTVPYRKRVSSFSFHDLEQMTDFLSKDQVIEDAKRRRTELKKN